LARKWCVIDAEGDVGKLGLLGVAFWTEGWQSYIEHHSTIKDALFWAAREGYTFVAHNAQYDLPVIFWQLDLEMKAVYYNDTFNRGEWKHDPSKPKAELWDSLNLAGGVSVAQLGRSLGLPKYDTPQILEGKDPNIYKWRCEAHEAWECLTCYALRDAEIVYRYMEAYTNTLAQWGVKPQRRIAGAASSVWRVLDRPGPIVISDKRTQYLARKSFFGGRVECFKLGHIPGVYTADVQSMYPSVMVETPFPNPADLVFMAEVHPSELPLHLEGVAECLVSIPHSYSPPLPNSQRGERVFGIGLQRGVWTFLELRYATQLGARIHRVYKASWSPTTLNPFPMFIGTLWELRQAYKTTEDARAQTAKVLLNSCYGRLGLKGKASCEIVEPWPSDRTLRQSIGAVPEEIGGKLYIRHETNAPYGLAWTNVMWASQITAAARVKLHRLMMLQGSNLVYCDTDSIFSMAPIVGLGDGLGQLSNQESYAEAWIVGPKLYHLAKPNGYETTRAKGVPRALALRFLRGEEVVFQSPVKPKEMIHRGHAAGSWMEITRSRQLVPYRRQPTNPGALTQDGSWSDTSPPVFG
jgi:hypothetical protein